MVFYLACVWDPDDSAAMARVRQVQAAVVPEPRETWSRPQPGLALLGRSQGGLAVQALSGGRGLVIGGLFPRAPTAAAQDGAFDLPGAGPTAWARRLLAETWGPYVAILREGPRGAAWIYREPSGALDGHVWRAAGVTFVASDLPARLRHALPGSVRVDWDRVSDMVRDPRLMAGPSALRGLEAVPPGALLGPGGEILELWTPAIAARGPRRSAEDAVVELPRLVDRCVAELSAGRRILAELSGGLDSAILGSALSRAPRANVVGWINYHPRDIAADERRSAREVAAYLGLDLTFASKPDIRLDPADLIRAAAGARPSLNRADPHYDDDMTKRVWAANADAIFTGQGGDTVFFQMPTPLIAADAWAAKGPRSWTASPLLGDLARWTRRSAWQVMAASSLALAGWTPSARSYSRLLPQAVREAKGARGPRWTQDLGDVPPAKRRQIEGLAHTQLFWGGCARGRAARLVHPLLSTPLVEYLLSIGADDLTEGGRDRALARRAFADRLPASVAGRRSKGVMTAYYGRMLAASLDHIRPWLMEGALAQRGLVDRAALGDLLSTEALMQHGGYADLMALIALQAWVDAWL